LITDKFIYKLDASGTKAFQKPIPLTDVSEVTVTSGPDQLVVIHLLPGNDLVFCMRPADLQQDFVGEVVGALTRALAYGNHKKDLKVNVTAPVNCSLGQKPRVVSVNLGGSTVPKFAKSGAQIALQWPAAAQS